jgi:hypothetical protein
VGAVCALTAKLTAKLNAQRTEAIQEDWDPWWAWFVVATGALPKGGACRQVTSSHQSRSRRRNPQPLATGQRRLGKPLRSASKPLWLLLPGEGKWAQPKDLVERPLARRQPRALRGGTATTVRRGQTATEFRVTVLGLGSPGGSGGGRDRRSLQD